MNKIPRFKPAANKLFNRSRFLDGTYPTYFAPGQRPDTYISYQPPDDWRPANTLLIAPRIVWLNVYTDLSILGDPIYETYQLNYYQTPNTAYQEHLRLLKVFEDTKSRIESIQKGKTWVEIVDWGSWGNQLGGDIGENFEDYISGVATYLSGSDGFLQFPTPPMSVDAGSFFGTDFLSVWAGDAAAGYAKWGGNGDGLPFFVSGPSSGFPESDGDSFGTSGNPYYDGPSARLKAFYAAFHRHGTMLFGPNNKWVSPVLTGPQRHAIIGLQDFSDSQPILEGFSNNFLAAAAADLADYGVSYGGFTSKLTAEYLIGQIAKHFNFDADTGRDL